MVKKRVKRAFPCSVCGQLFSSISKACKHVETKHPVQVKYFTKAN